MTSTKYPPLFPYTRRFFNLPNIISSNDQILVFFLTKTDPDERSEMLKKIEDGDREPLPEGVKRRSLAAIPWLRNYEPSIQDVFKLLKDTEYGHVCGSPCVFIDSRGVGEGTIVVSHFLNPKDGEPDGRQEAARVPIAQSYQLLCEARRDQSWFTQNLDEECRVKEEDVDEGWEGKSAEYRWEWPEHLPTDLKLEEKNPAIVSLIHLSDTELDAIKSEIPQDDRYTDIEIINWPADVEPASEADMWNIMDQIKPDWESVAPYGQMFGFFISSTHLSGAERQPRIIVAQRQQLASHERTKPLSTYDLGTENTTNMWFCETRGFWRAWHAAWNPTGGAYCSSVRENDAIRQLWNDRTFLFAFAEITNPEVPVRLPRCDVPVFLLQPISASQEYALRAIFNMENEPQLLYVPESDGTTRKLIQYLQSPAWMCYHKRPPGDFIAVDARTLSTYDSATQAFQIGYTSFILATTAMVWHYDSNDGMIARDDVGYVTGRTIMYDDDDYQMWTGRAFQSMGLGGCIDNCRPDDDDMDGEGVERYYWDCFDVENEELRALVSTME